MRCSYASDPNVGDEHVTPSLPGDRLLDEGFDLFSS
jgi:hypothetical protein